MSETDEQRARRKAIFDDAQEAFGEIAGPVTAVIQRDPHGQLTGTVSPDVWHGKKEVPDD